MKDYLLAILLGTALLSACHMDKRSMLAPPEEAAPALWEGRWRSTQNPEQVITIQGNNWLESQRGQSLPTQKVEYQAECSLQDTSKPCLLVKGGFDVTVYTFRYLDVNTIELQLFDQPAVTYKRQ